jgi:hypothetical protein
MSAIDLINVGLAGLNCVLALVLGGVYWRNHREMRSPFTLGLLLFAVFLLVHNALIVYHAMTMMDAASARDANLLLLDEALQTAAVGALLAATMR